MKYIRTKDEIYEIDKDISYSGKEIYKVRNHDFSIIGNGLQKADTIEELCDGFYLDLGGEFDDTYLRRKDRFEFLKELTLNYMRKDIKVTLYAFIKTSKDLTYVAKLNDKGKLELI